MFPHPTLNPYTRSTPALLDPPHILQRRGRERDQTHHQDENFNSKFTTTKVWSIQVW